MSGKALRLIGGAGTGKTTALMDTMDKALGAGHYRPEDVAFVSFTKAARGEAAARAATRFGGTAKTLQDDGWFRTLHSCCYRLLGVNKKQMVTESKKDQTWLLDEIGGRQEHIEGALGVWDYARSTCCHLSVAYRVIKETASTDSSIKLPNTFEDCADIVERYEKAKYRDNRLDFTDLLSIYAGWKFRAKEDPERVRPVGDVPDVPVFFIDECVRGDADVYMGDGSKMKIADIVENKTGGFVLSFNRSTGYIEKRRIAGWHKVPRNGRRFVAIGGGACVTEDHPVFVGDEGYVPASHLSGRSVLEIDIEKLRSSGLSDGLGEVHYSRVASWRRFNRESEVERRSRERSCCVCPRVASGVLPELEVRDAVQVGENPARGDDTNFVRWDDAEICHCVASAVHGNTRTVQARWWQENDNTQVAVNAHSAICGGLVYGRRVRRSSLFFTSCSVQKTRGGVGNSEVFSHAWNQRQDLGDKEGSSCFLQREGCGVVYIYSGALHAPGVDVQSPPVEVLSRGVGSCFCRAVVNSECEICVSDLRVGVCEARKQEGLFGEVCGEAVRNKKIPEDEEEKDGFVYCLSIEGNNNFFVGGVLVHNCQDLSALSSSVAHRLREKARWVYLAGDPYQSLYGFSGAHPRYFMEWPVDKESTMPKSYRCPPPIMELGEAIIRDCTDYFDRGIAPADHPGEVSRGFLHNAIQYEPFTNGESWMLLARTNWQARVISDGLSRRGIPWMSLDGNSPWNSPARNKLTFALLALEQGRPITSAEWRDIVRSDELPVKGNFTPGLRAAHSRNEQIPDEFRLLTLDELHTVGALPGLVSMIQTREWRRCIPRANEFLDAIEKHGVAATLEPKVSVGTIHSAKGAEADNVILSTAISAPVVWGKNTDEGNNAELRVWYVGATRARKRLVVADDHTARFRQEIPV